MFGIFFWVLDEWVGWNILPDALQAYAEAIIAAAGIVAGLLLTGILLGFLGLFAHWVGRSSQYPEAHVPPRLMVRLKRAGLAIPVLVVLAGAVDHVRQKVLTQRAEVQRSERDARVLERATRDLRRHAGVLAERMPGLLGTLGPVEARILQELVLDPEAVSLENHRILHRYCRALEQSCPFTPRLTWILPAPHPYRYAVVRHNPGVVPGQVVRKKDDPPPLFFQVDYLTNWPDGREASVVAAALEGNVKSLNGLLRGRVIDNNRPSSFGVVLSEQSPMLLVLTSPMQFGHIKAYHTGGGVGHTPSWEAP